MNPSFFDSTGNTPERKGEFMKILHCLAQLPIKTGSGVYCSTVVNAMVARKHKNAVIYGVQDPFDIRFDRQVVEYPVRFLSKELPFPIAGMSDEMPYESTIYSEMTEDMLEIWHKAFRERLLRAKEEFQPDLILCHHLFLLTTLVREVFPDTVIVGITHGTDLRQLRKHPYFQERCIGKISNLDAFFAIAPKDALEIENLFDIETSKISTMGGGFPAGVFYEREGAPSLTGLNVMYAGKMSSSKGIFELAKTIPLLSKKFPDVTLHLVGNADEASKQELYRLAGGKDHLLIYNCDTQKDMADRLRHMDVFVLPSYYEGLGLVAIEALACGVRTVATEIEGLMWLLGDEVNRSGVIEYVPLPRLYDVDKPYEEDKGVFVEHLAQKIILQLERAEKKEGFPDKIKPLISNHSWDVIMDRMEEKITALINKENL